MAGISVGDIVFVRFPFSDLSQHKLRPALVLAKAGNDDFIYARLQAGLMPIRKPLCYNKTVLHGGTCAKSVMCDRQSCSPPYSSIPKGI